MRLDRGRRRVYVQLAELAAEIEMLLRREMLVAEKDHEIFSQRAMDLVHLPVRRLAQIDLADLGPDDRGQLVHRDRFIGRVRRYVLDPRTAEAAQRTLHEVSPGDVSRRKPGGRLYR